MIRRSLIAVALAVAAVAGTAAAGPTKIAWQRNYDKGQALARKAGKPMMIDFYTDWCGWCKELDKKTWPDKRVVKSAQQFVAIKLDAEKEGRALAQRFNVRGYPYILFLKSDGSKIGEIPGYGPPEKIAPELNRIAALARK